MNQREKVLAGCLVTAIVGCGGFALIKSRVYEPGEKLKQDIEKQKQRRSNLQVRLNGADKTVAAWYGWTGQTLHADPFKAHQAFREDVDLLLDRNKLTEGLAINKYKERRETKGVRKGFVELPLSVRVTGKLGDLVNFLKDFYQRPYPVRVDRLTLNAEPARRSGSRKRTGPTPEPKLSIVMTLTTLVLPKVEDLEHPTIDLAALNNPEVEPLLVSPPRLMEEDLVTYNDIPSVNIFKIYEEPRVVAAPREEKDPPKPKETPRPPPPPPDPRRDAHKLVVKGMGWLDDGPIAYVVNVDEAIDPPAEYRLNDEIDDGKLVLVIPQGIVVRVLPPERGRPQPPTDYFYALGETFRDRVEVNPSEHPEVARLLDLVLKQ